MSIFKYLWVIIFTIFLFHTGFSANIYSVKCPKCDNYEADIRTGRNKMNPDVYRAYFCVKEKFLFSLPDSKVKMTSDKKKKIFQVQDLSTLKNCTSELIPFDLEKKNQVCPICNKGIIEAKLKIRAC